MLTSLGNDIVDLKASEPPLNPRFIERVLTQQEKDSVRDSMQLLWLHWAAKEAAYKTLSRGDPNLVFAHKEFEFNFQEKTIRHNGEILPCLVEETDDFVAVVCATQAKLLKSNELSHWISQIDAGQDSSAAIRESARAKIANRLSVPEETIEISQPRKKNTPPTALISGQGANLLSFAHHGRFIAIAFALI